MAIAMVSKSNDVPTGYGNAPPMTVGCTTDVARGGLRPGVARSRFGGQPDPADRALPDIGGRPSRALADSHPDDLLTTGSRVETRRPN
jgi:hypothetical protein